MWIKEYEYFVRCDCGDTSNMLSLYFDCEKDEYGNRELFIHQRVDTETFWQRLKAGVKYIFKPSKLLLYGETIISPDTEEGKQELDGLIEFLQRVRMKDRPERLMALRTKAIDAGMRLLTEDEVLMEDKPK